MLERYSISVTREVLSERFRGIEVTDRYKPRYNAAPSQLLPVVTNEHPTGFSFFYWGTIPKWSGRRGISRKLINAEKDEIFEKPTYRKAIENKRCLIPADGFYGWKIVGKKSRIPHRIILKQSQPFFMAGLWEEYQDDTDEIIHTFIIITTQSNELVAPISETMPAILTDRQASDWLNPHNSKESLLGMLGIFPAEQMGMYTVSPMIDSQQHDTPSMIQPAPPVDQFGNFTLFN
ncbi:MAG: putative SOS response-associated peptidase YoqW [Cyclobacteriaceae bacterium]|nr:MAG: putative SOS response-associated peptidase YoqW [Cyclobacteriaceae bacterium]